MKKLLLSIFIAFMASTMASAQSFTVDGITYKLTTTSVDATVLVEKGPCSESVEIPATVTYDNVTYRVEAIGVYAFQNCTELTSVTIAEGVARIASSAFQECTNLTSVTLPVSSMTSIGNMAFQDCVKLSSVTLPSSVTKIGSGAFRGCTSLTSIVIPEGVTSIQDFAFGGCTGLTSIVIPEGVTSIQDYAFGDCTKLNSITFGNGMMDIASDAFSNCSNVKSVTFLGVMPLNDVFKGIGKAESPVALKIPSLWPTNDKPVNSSTPWHGGYFNCEYVDPVKEFLGEMGTPCTDCPAIEVIKGDKIIKLYNPDKVNFIKSSK